MKKTMMLAAMVLAVGACSPKVGVKVTVVDTKTQLENQITGTYSALEEQAWMVASVRGEEGNKELQKFSVSDREVFQAINSRKYYADDLADFMNGGCLGENKQGLVEKRPEACTAKSEADVKLLDDVAQKENTARSTIMRGVVAKNLSLKESDLPAVQEAFAKKQRDEAKPGWWLQNADGTWEQKK